MLCYLSEVLFKVLKKVYCKDDVAKLNKRTSRHYSTHFRGILRFINFNLPLQNVIVIFVNIKIILLHFERNLTIGSQTCCPRFACITAFATFLTIEFRRSFKCHQCSAARLWSTAANFKNHSKLDYKHENISKNQFWNLRRLER